MRYRRIRRL